MKTKINVSVSLFFLQFKTTTFYNHPTMSNNMATKGDV